MAAQAYLGIDADAWTLLFSAIQTLAVVFGVVFGLHQLADLRRRRGWESLETMLGKWRAGMPSQYVVLDWMPAYPPCHDVCQRAEQLAEDLLATAKATADHDGFAKLLEAARDVVHDLNDLGVYVERGSVDERDFYGQFHVRVLELAFLLEPWVLLVSTCRGSRWGWRLRRLRQGAERYHCTARIHRGIDIKVRDQVVLHGDSVGPVPWFRERHLRRRLTPRKERTYRTEDRLMAEFGEQLDKLLTANGLKRETFLDALPVRI